MKLSLLSQKIILAAIIIFFGLIYYADTINTKAAWLSVSNPTFSIGGSLYGDHNKCIMPDPRPEVLLLVSKISIILLSVLTLIVLLEFHKKKIGHHNDKKLIFIEVFIILVLVFNLILHLPIVNSDVDYIRQCL